MVNAVRAFVLRGAILGILWVPTTMLIKGTFAERWRQVELSTSQPSPDYAAMHCRILARTGDHSDADCSTPM